ncbi:MAG: endonuclease I family protein [Limisphaerales bacterium]
MPPVVAVVFRRLIPALCLFACLTARAGPPPGYYDAAAGLGGAALQAALHGIVNGHTVVPYSSASQTDAVDALGVLDEDPANAANVILFYNGRSDPKSAFNTTAGWDREHLWPNSYGIDDAGPEFSDLHNLRPTDRNVNSSRGNKWFDAVAPGDPGYASPAHPEAPGNEASSIAWEPPNTLKGDVARAAFYMDTRYEGTGGEPDLALTSDYGNISSSAAFMGNLSTLRAWHALDPVDAAEVTRNDRVFALYQGNRNPFVDRPEFVEALYGTNAPPTNPPPAASVLLARWNFNGLAAGTAAAPPVSEGAGAAQPVGVGSESFVSGTGSSDPETTSDSAWSVTGFPAQGTAPRTAGVQFSVNTTGHSNVILSFDFRASNTAGRRLVVLASADGAAWTEAGAFLVTAGGVFTNQIAVSLAGVPVANNQPGFTVRLVSDFDGGSQYQGVAGGYGTTGTWRFDMVTVTGAPAAFTEPDFNLDISTPDHGQTALLSWDTAPGVQYRVDVSTNLTVWTEETGWITATGGSLSHISPVPGGKKFFRIRSR